MFDCLYDDEYWFDWICVVVFFCKFVFFFFGGFLDGDGCVD